MSGAPVSAASPGGRPPGGDDAPGALGTLGGMTVRILGRTLGGAWLVVPAYAWGTRQARHLVFLSATRPTPRGFGASPRRSDRDRRGHWSRRR